MKEKEKKQRETIQAAIYGKREKQLRTKLLIPGKKIQAETITISINESFEDLLQKNIKVKDVTFSINSSSFSEPLAHFLHFTREEKKGPESAIYILQHDEIGDMSANFHCEKETLRVKDIEISSEAFETAQTTKIGNNLHQMIVKENLPKRWEYPQEKICAIYHGITFILSKQSKKIINIRIHN